MKNKAFKRTIALILALISLVSTIVVPINVSAANDYWIDVTSDVYLHSEPYKDSPKTDAVYVGETYRVIDECTNSFGNLWLKTELGYLYSGHTKKHTKHVAIMCGPGSTSYEFIDPDNHNKVVYSGDDICGCGAKCGEGTYTRKKENHFFENKTCVSCGYQAVYKTDDFSEPVYIQIVDNNTPIYAEPTRYSTRKGTLNNEDITKATAKVTNMYNNVWFAVDSGGYVYSDHIADHIHKGVKCGQGWYDYQQNNGESHLKLNNNGGEFCSCGFQVADNSVTHTIEEKHQFNNDLICEKCGYKSVVSTATTTTTTEAAKVATTAPAIDTSHFYVDTEIKTGCSSTSYERGELISSTIDKGNIKHHYIVDIYEKACASCGGLVSEGHKNNDNTSKYITEKTAVDHHFLTNDLGQEYCDICDFNVALFLAENEIMLLKVQIALSIVGQLPYLGEGADIIDGLIAFSHGDIADGLLSFSAAVPFSGNAPGTANIINKAIDYNKSSERLKELSKLANKTDIKMSDIFNSSDIYFSNFNNYKKVMGTAPEGFHIHHLVEQSQVNRAGFKAELVYSTANSIIIDAETHYKITRFYNSSFQGYASFRDYITTLPFEQQYQLGLQVLQTFDVIT